MKPLIASNILLTNLFSTTEEKMKRRKQLKNSKWAKGPTGNEMCNEIREKAGEKEDWYTACVLDITYALRLRVRYHITAVTFDLMVDYYQTEFGEDGGSNIGRA